MLQGLGWTTMEQGPMDLTVPDVDRPVGLDPGFESWLSSLGGDARASGSLSGEWNTNWMGIYSTAEQPENASQ
jgi:hypothetical protein